MKLKLIKHTPEQADFIVEERNPFRLDIERVSLHKGISPSIALWASDHLIKILPLCHTKSIIERQWRDAYKECYKALIQHRIHWYEKDTTFIQSVYRQIASHKTDPVTIYAKHRVWARFDNEWDVELPPHETLHTSSYGNVIAFETIDDTFEWEN